MWIIDVTDFSFYNLCMVFLFVILLSFVISLTYYFTNHKHGVDRSFLVSLFILPIAICAVIMLVGNNYARAFSLAGIFTLVRFRTSIADIKSMIYLIITVVLGLATGMGYITYSIIVTVALCLLLVIIYFTKFESPKSNMYKLRITIPESLNFDHVFDELFNKHLKTYTLKKVKSVDFGTMFELSYDIVSKSNFSQKEFIDEIRVLNGNLNITLTSNYMVEVAKED